MDMKKMLEILVCPVCRQGLSLLEERGEQGLHCQNCDKVYPVRDGIPVMLADESLPRADWPQK